jgi:hypothetical protein
LAEQNISQAHTVLLLHRVLHLGKRRAVIHPQKKALGPDKSANRRLWLQMQPIIDDLFHDRPQSTAFFLR